MYRTGQSPPTEALNIFLNGGGVGDHVAALPSVLSASKQNVNITLFVPDFFIDFAKDMLPNIQVLGFKDVEKRDKQASAVQTISAAHTPMRMHLVDYAATMITDKQLDEDEKNYLRYPVGKNSISRFNLPEKYVVLTPAYTAPVREWHPDIINEVSAYVVDKGYTPVYIGSDKTLLVAKHGSQSVTYKGQFNETVNYSNGINLVNKTSLSEAAEIMAKARAVVGLDNGLLHVAGCTDVPIVGGFTSVDPKYRMPYRNNVMGLNFYPVVPDKSLECRFCQSNWSFVYEFDFKTCYYKEKGFDDRIRCVTDLTADKYIEQLEKIL